MIVIEHTIWKFIYSVAQSIQTTFINTDVLCSRVKKLYPRAVTAMVNSTTWSRSDAMDISEEVISVSDLANDPIIPFHAPFWKLPYLYPLRTTGLYLNPNAI